MIIFAIVILMVGLSLFFFTKNFLKYKIKSPNKPIRKIIRKQFFKQMWVCAIFSVGLLIINTIFVKTELSYDQFELDNDKSSHKYLKKIYGARCCDIFYSYEKCEKCGEYHKDDDLAVCHICWEKVKETGDMYEYKVNDNGKPTNYLAFVKSSSIYELPKDKKPFVRIKKIKIEQKYLRIWRTDKIEYVYEFYIPGGKI